MWDATAKPSSGLLSGNTNQLGDYDSCLGVQFASLGALQGKYCLADIDLEASATARYSVRAAVTRLQAGAFVRSKHSDVSLPWSLAKGSWQIYKLNTPNCLMMGTKVAILIHIKWFLHVDTSDGFVHQISIHLYRMTHKKDLFLCSNYSKN